MQKYKVKGQSAQKIVKTWSFPILVTEHWARCADSQPAGDFLSHLPGRRLPLLFTRPVVLPPSRIAPPPIGRYQIIPLGDRGTCVWATCPRLLLGSGPAEIRTRDHLDLPLRHSGHAKYRARQLYKNISMLFLFSVKYGKLSTGVHASFDAPCYG